MAIVESNDIFFTEFEPKQANRFRMLIDGFPAYMVKGVSAVSLTQGTVTLNHINVQRYVKGKTTWGTIDFTLFDPITPSGAQAVMEWVRLHHESVTGRDGYSDFYKKDITFNSLGPVGDKVEEWTLKGAYIQTAKFSDMDYTGEDLATVDLTLTYDYAILQY